MKKSRLVGIAALAVFPVLLTAACGAPAGLTLSANWYSNPDNTNPSGTYEKVTYDVEFKPTDPTAKFRVEYEKGVYTTTLRDENIAEAAGTPVGYHLHTELSMTGNYILNEVKGETFTDTVVSDAYFLLAADSLRPVRSEKRVVSHSPNTSASTPDQCAVLFDYSLVTTYNDDLTSATVVYHDNATDTDRESTVKLKGSTTYFDNEEILFAMRGVSADGDFNFRSINPLSRTAVTVEASGVETVETSATFAVNDGDAEERALDAIKMTLSYSGTYRGAPQTLFYAKRAESGTNVNRNLLLRMEVPTLNDLGTLIFYVTSAEFNEK